MRSPRCQCHLLVRLLAFLLLANTEIAATVANDHNQEGRAQDDRLLELAKRAMPEQQFCGSKLADYIDLLCRGKYKSVFEKKAGNAGIRREMDLEDDLGRLEYGELEDYPFRTRELAHSMLLGRLGYGGGGRGRFFHRGRRGIHDECCLKPCSIDELMGYCSD